MAIIVCSFADCVRKRHSLGLCQAHYSQKRSGSALQPLRGQRTVAWRLDASTNKTDTCWLWLGATMAAGYGHLYSGNRMVGVHRLSYERHVGTIPDGMEIDHKCHVRNCLNPSHLRLASSGENSQNLSGARSDSGTGYTGVHYYKARGTYTAYINLDGKRTNLGYFTTAELAWEARKAKELEMFTHSPLHKKVMC